MMPADKLIDIQAYILVIDLNLPQKSHKQHFSCILGIRVQYNLAELMFLFMVNPINVLSLTHQRIGKQKYISLS